jgi:hypothetical protein
LKNNPAKDKKEKNQTQENNKNRKTRSPFIYKILSPESLKHNTRRKETKQEMLKKPTRKMTLKLMPKID